MVRLTLNGLTRKVRAVIFDKDGTLMDFHTLWGEIARQRITNILEGIGRRTSDVGREGPLFRRPIFRSSDELRRHLAAAIGLGADGAIDPGGPLATGNWAEEMILAAGQLYLHLGIPFVQARELCRQAFDAVDEEELHRTHVRPLPGVPEVMQRLRNAGLLLGVASTDRTDNVRNDNRLLGIEQLVSVAMGADRVAQGKPQPDMLVLAAGELGVPVTEMIMVGDGVVDLQMGRNAGVAFTIGVLNGIGPAEQLRPHADLLLPSLADWPWEALSP